MLTAPVAQYAVTLGADGRVISRGAPSVVIAESQDTLAADIAAQEDVLADTVEPPSNETKAKPDGDGQPDSGGKLIAEEEIAVGHVEWPIREFTAPPLLSSEITFYFSKSKSTSKVSGANTPCFSTLRLLAVSF